MSFRRGETDRIREPRTAAVPMVFGYLVEVGPDDYEPTGDLSIATHLHVLDEVANEIIVAPIGTDPGGVRTVKIGEDTYMLAGV